MKINWYRILGGGFFFALAALLAYVLITLVLWAGEVL